ncbi:acyl-CoA synthetase [Alphaproteobacteria bacterium]|nr:acyl-CoA synthetase [Alphaproteobacteria bacterium]
MSSFDPDLVQNAANYVPLSPISFLKRTAAVYPDREAVIYGRIRRTWSQTADRCRALASALKARGIGEGDVVAVMLPNIPEAFEAHYGVPMSGGVLNMLNTRLDADTIAYCLDHGGAKILITDTGFADVIEEALAVLDRDIEVIDVHDLQGGAAESRLGAIDYEALLLEGDTSFPGETPTNEWQALALNYTSGTTGRPKGVVYHHRGAYMTAVGNSLTWAMPHHPIYLWTLPMFHCNGWCFPWTITAMAGTHVCLRAVTAEGIYREIADNGVTHLCGAPIVMSMIINAGVGERRDFDNRKISMMTAASAPPAAVLQKITAQGFEITHVYGLTEVYGPAVVCAWQSSWDDLSPEGKSDQLARQGVPYAVQEALMVANPDTMKSVPADGKTIGEIMLRGNQTMKGYLNNPEANAETFRGGWFHTGDLAVMHSDGYCEIKDRAKDIIISGGENISTIEVEGALYRHPDVVEAAVVAKPNDKWGETPCAFVEKRLGATVNEQDLIDFCRENLAHFKCPKHVVFGELPKTSTGKVQKFVLREKAKEI